MARGHVYRRQRAGGRAGRWHAVIDTARTASGRRRQMTRTFDTLGEAHAWLAEQTSSQQAGAPEDVTVGEFLRMWLDRQGSLRPSTRRSYRSHVDRHVLPALGDVPLTQLNAVMVDRFVGSLADRGLAASTQRRVIATLRSALAHAVRVGLVPTNVASAIRVRPGLPRPSRTWTPSESARFLDSLGQRCQDVLFRLALTTGMRRGELLALRWDQVDLAASTARVVASRVPVGGLVVEGPPKSANGTRTVYLDAVTVALLAGLQGPTGPEARRDRLVFVDDAGAGLVPWKVSRDFLAASERAGVPRIRFHDLRHTSATLGLAAGESLKEVSARLGHSGIGVTADIYSDVLPQVARRSTDLRVALMVGHAPTTQFGGDEA
jgi:integrase